ncbi:MAG: hypothetical protein AAB546_04110 [Patescibacteria group bacterium]
MIFIVIASIVGLLFWIVFKLTIGSIEGLGFNLNRFYPFNLIIKRPTLWSTLFYLLVIGILTFGVLILSNRQFWGKLF